MGEFWEGVDAVYAVFYMLELLTRLMFLLFLFVLFVLLSFYACLYVERIIYYASRGPVAFAEAVL